MLTHTARTTATRPSHTRPSGVDLLSALSADAEAVKEMVRAAASRGRPIETDHFVVVTTSAESRAWELARRLEAVYLAHVRFLHELDLPAQRPKHKLVVYFFADYQEFAEYTRGTASLPAPTEMLGFYDAELNRSAFYDLDTHPELQRLREAVARAAPEARTTLERRLERRREALLVTVVQHEAAHQVEDNIGLWPSPDAAPTWLVEGLAMLFEVPLDATGRPREPVNGYRLHEFRELYGGGVQALGNVPQLLVDDAAWCGGKCYPLAWALTWYLREEHRGGLAALVRRVATGGGWPRDTAERRTILSELFGPLDDQWIERFHAEIMKLPLDTSVFAE